MKKIKLSAALLSLCLLGSALNAQSPNAAKIELNWSAVQTDARFFTELESAQDYNYQRLRERCQNMLDCKMREQNIKQVGADNNLTAEYEKLWTEVFNDKNLYNNYNNINKHDEKKLREKHMYVFEQAPEVCEGAMVTPAVMITRNTCLPENGLRKSSFSFLRRQLLGGYPHTFDYSRIDKMSLFLDNNKVFSRAFGDNRYTTDFTTSTYNLPVYEYKKATRTVEPEDAKAYLGEKAVSGQSRIKVAASEDFAFIDLGITGFNSAKAAPPVIVVFKNAQERGAFYNRLNFYTGAGEFDKAVKDNEIYAAGVFGDKPVREVKSKYADFKPGTPLFHRYYNNIEGKYKEVLVALGGEDIYKPFSHISPAVALKLQEMYGDAITLVDYNFDKIKLVRVQDNKITVTRVK
jgi:hypothetical protein